MDPLKKFLNRHNIPSEIVSDVKFAGNSIYVHLKEGSVKKHGVEMQSAFKTLSTCSFSGAVYNDTISFWVPFLEDVVEANNKHDYESQKRNRPG